MVIIQELSIEDLKAIIDGCINKAIVQASDVEPKKDQLFTRNEAADYLHISLGTLHSHTKNGRLCGQRIGARLLYRKSDLDKFLKPTK